MLKNYKEKIEKRSVTLLVFSLFFVVILSQNTFAADINNSNNVLTKNINVTQTNGLRILYIPIEDVSPVEFSDATTRDYSDEFEGMDEANYLIKAAESSTLNSRPSVVDDSLFENVGENIAEENKEILLELAEKAKIQDKPVAQKTQSDNVASKTTTRKSPILGILLLTFSLFMIIGLIILIGHIYKNG